MDGITVDKGRLIEMVLIGKDCDIWETTRVIYGLSHYFDIQSVLHYMGDMRKVDVNEVVDFSI